MKNIVLFVVAIFAFHSNAAPSKDGAVEQIFDQRQNGTENYRINVDGVFVMIAPAEELINAAQGLDLDQIITLAEGVDQGFVLQDVSNKIKGSNATKPKPSLLNAAPSKAPANPEKKQSDNDKSVRLRQRFISFLRPILRRFKPTVI